MLSLAAHRITWVVNLSCTCHGGSGLHKRQRVCTVESRGGSSTPWLLAIGQAVALIHARFSAHPDDDNGHAAEGEGASLPWPALAWPALAWPILHFIS
jgi:hypothetical protein